MSSVLIYAAQNCLENFRQVHSVAVAFTLSGSSTAEFSNGSSWDQGIEGSAGWSSERVDLSLSDLIKYGGFPPTNPNVDAQFYALAAKCNSAGFSDHSTRVRGSAGLVGSYGFTGSYNVVQPDGSVNVLTCNSNRDPTATGPGDPTYPLAPISNGSAYFNVGFVIAGAGGNPNGIAHIQAFAGGYSLQSPLSGPDVILSRNLFGSHSFTYEHDSGADPTFFLNPCGFGEPDDYGLPGGTTGTINSSLTYTITVTIG